MEDQHNRSKADQFLAELSGPAVTKMAVREDIGSPKPEEMYATVKEKVGKDVEMKDLYVLDSEEDEEVRKI